MESNMNDSKSSKVEVRRVLDKHQLGPARMADHKGELYVFLENGEVSDMAKHLAMSDLEKIIGLPVQIRALHDLHPAALARVQQQTISV